MPNSAFAGHNHIGGDAEEQAVLDDAGAGAELGCQRVYVGDGAEIAVEDHVARVGDELRAILLVLANDAASAERFQEAQLRAPSEWTDFERQGEAGAEAVGELAVVHHDDFARAGLSDDFFAENHSASSFDEVELGI